MAQSGTRRPEYEKYTRRDQEEIKPEIVTSVNFIGHCDRGS